VTTTPAHSSQVLYPPDSWPGTRRHPGSASSSTPCRTRPSASVQRRAAGKPSVTAATATGYSALILLKLSPAVRRQRGPLPSTYDRDAEVVVEDLVSVDDVACRRRRVDVDRCTSATGVPTLPRTPRPQARSRLDDDSSSDASSSSVPMPRSSTEPCACCAVIVARRNGESACVCSRGGGDRSDADPGHVRVAVVRGGDRKGLVEAPERWCPRAVRGRRVLVAATGSRRAGPRPRSSTGRGSPARRSGAQVNFGRLGVPGWDAARRRDAWGGCRR
jgi:hypothetical protein